MKAPSEEIYGKSTQGTSEHNVDLKSSLNSVAKDKGIATLFLMQGLTQKSNGSIISLFYIFQYFNSK